MNKLKSESGVEGEPEGLEVEVEREAGESGPRSPPVDKVERLQRERERNRGRRGRRGGMRRAGDVSGERRRTHAQGGEQVGHHSPRQPHCGRELQVSDEIHLQLSSLYSYKRVSN